MIRFHCTQCGRAYVVDPRFAGKAIRCRACSASLVVPVSVQPPPQSPVRAPAARLPGATRRELQGPEQIEIRDAGGPDEEDSGVRGRAGLTAEAILARAAQERPGRLHELRASSYLAGMRRLALLHFGIVVFSTVQLVMGYLGSRDLFFLIVCLGNLIPLTMGILVLRLHHWMNWVVAALGSLGALGAVGSLFRPPPSGLAAGSVLLILLVNALLAVQSTVNLLKLRQLGAGPSRPDLLARASPISLFRAALALAIVAALAMGHRYYFRSVEIVFPDGSRYVGKLHPVTRQPEGFGNRLYPDGSIYVGNWANGERHGEGTLAFRHGGSLQGEWEEGKLPDGGIYRSPQGRELPCRWSPEENSIHTEGSLELRSGSSYSGGLVILLGAGGAFPHGQGAATTVNGRGYEGPWKRGQIIGPGKLTYPDGTVYQGGLRSLAPAVSAGQPADFEQSCLQAVPHGPGKATLSDGTACEGSWSNGVLHGKGVIRSPDGTESNAIWHMGRQGDRIWPDLRLPGSKAGAPAPVLPPSGGRPLTPPGRNRSSG